MVRRAPSRDGRGRRAAVDFVVCFGCGEVFLCFLSIFSFSFERIWPAASISLPCLVYLSISTNCESCTRPISTNSRSMGEDEYMLAGRMCLIARRFEMVVFAGLLWILWCGLGAAGFFVFFFKLFFFFRTHIACCKYEPALSSSPLY